MSKRATKVPAGAPPDPLAVAYDAATALGHKPCHVRGEYDCWICGVTGAMGRGPEHELTGPIFEEKCR